MLRAVAFCARSCVKFKSSLNMDFSNIITSHGLKLHFASFQECLILVFMNLRMYSANSHMPTVTIVIVFHGSFLFIVVLNPFNPYSFLNFYHST